MVLRLAPTLTASLFLDGGSIASSDVGSIVIMVFDACADYAMSGSDWGRSEQLVDSGVVSAITS